MSASFLLEPWREDDVVARLEIVGEVLSGELAAKLPARVGILLEFGVGVVWDRRCVATALARLLDSLGLEALSVVSHGETSPIVALGGVLHVLRGAEKAILGLAGVCGVILVVPDLAAPETACVRLDERAALALVGELLAALNKLKVRRTRDGIGLG